MKLSKKQLRTLIESIIKEGKKLEFRLPSPARITGVSMNISGKTTVIFKQSASARNRFAIYSKHPFTADGIKAQKEDPNPLVTYDHYIFETKLGGSSKEIVIEPDKRYQKFRVKSDSSR